MKIKLTHPLISCICITAHRPEKLLKAIVNFDHQDYPNKELVISYPESDLASKELLHKIAGITEHPIIILERPDHLTIGAARNEAVAKANGEYVCTWDDDDFYHTMRVKYQYNNMQVNGQYREACLVTRIILYDSANGKAYHSFPHYWAGSLLCKKEIVLKHPFTDDNIGEADALIDYLDTHHYLHCIEDFGILYTYIYHGENKTHYEDFELFIKDSGLLDQQNSEWVTGNVNQQYQLIMN